MGHTIQLKSIVQLFFPLKMQQVPVQDQYIVPNCYFLLIWWIIVWKNNYYKQKWYFFILFFTTNIRSTGSPNLVWGSVLTSSGFSPLLIAVAEIKLWSFLPNSATVTTELFFCI
jgi:hypothetical protein